MSRTLARVGLSSSTYRNVSSYSTPEECGADHNCNRVAIRGVVVGGYKRCGGGCSGQWQVSASGIDYCLCITRGNN